MGERERYMEDVYKFLIKNLVNERMDKIVARNKRFRQADKRYSEALKRCDNLSLSKTDAKVVDRAISAFAAQSAVYAELTYIQGMKDAVKLLKKVGVI